MRVFRSLLLLAVLLTVPAVWFVQRAAPRPPNIVLISIDSMRRDRLSAYGYYRRTTPALERLAAEGIRFGRTYTNGGFTLRSHMSLMTSLKPAVHGVTESSGLALGDDRTTLAETLAGAGYRTGGFVDDGWMAGGFGFRRGFDVYDDDGGGLAVTLPKALAWLTADASRPSFLFLHSYDVHSAYDTRPYDCPDDYLYRYVSREDALGCKDGRCASDLITWIDQEVEAGRLIAGEYLTDREQQAMSAMYDGCIAYADHKLGELFDTLRERSLYDDALIVVLSDHGEEFLEHGMVGHYQDGYEEIVAIPLIVKPPSPSHAQRGRQVDELAAMVDVMPTILDIVGVQPPRIIQGFSLVPAVDQQRPVREALRSGDALITLDWKLLSDRKELLPFPGTPKWQENQYARQPGRTATLEQMLTARIATDRAVAASLDGRMTRPSPIDGALRERLRSLGYLGQ